MAQALDTANKTSSSVSSLNSGVTQTMQTELRGVKDQLSNVTGLSAKVDGIANDVSDLTSAAKSMQVGMNRMAQQLPILAIRLSCSQRRPLRRQGRIPVPNILGCGRCSAAAAQCADAVQQRGPGRQNSNNLDLALSGFTQFLHLYPDDPNAIRAQYNIGNIYYAQPEAGRCDHGVQCRDRAI